jgi:hypothetical protein
MSTVTIPGSNECAGLTEEQHERLARAAANLVGARGVMIRIADFVGASLNQLGGKAAGMALHALGSAVQTKIEALVHEVLWRAYGAATTGLDPAGEREPWDWFNKAIVSASGAASGFLGLPGLAFDLPITTGMIIRSLAEIARAHGEDISSDSCRRACLEVFVLGGPETDEDAEIGYWSTRAALSQLAIQSLLNQASKRFGLAISQKVGAQLVPAIGAVTGSGLNYIFMDYYQQMARAHFTIRALERETGNTESVRACFDTLVRTLRQRRGLRKS